MFVYLICQLPTDGMHFKYAQRNVSSKPINTQLKCENFPLRCKWKNSPKFNMTPSSETNALVRESFTSEFVACVTLQIMLQLTERQRICKLDICSLVWILPHKHTIAHIPAKCERTSNKWCAQQWIAKTLKIHAKLETMKCARMEDRVLCIYFGCTQSTELFNIHVNCFEGYRHPILRCSCYLLTQILAQSHRRNFSYFVRQQFWLDSHGTYICVWTGSQYFRKHTHLTVWHSRYIRTHRPVCTVRLPNLKPPKPHSPSSNVSTEKV